MQSSATSIDQYISDLPEERKAAIIKLRKTIAENLPAGFEEGMLYGMPGFYVPFSLYPNGYHCDTTKPLGFISYAAQKNFYSVYNMGLYSDSKLMEWFVAEYPKHSSKKLDMGKSCIRFKKETDIPYELIGQLSSKMSPEKWIEIYESILLKSKSKSK